MHSDPLALPPEEMRRLGYRAVDALVAATTEWTMPPIRRATRSEMRSLLHHAPPAAGIGGDEALARLLGDAMPYIARNDHPRFFGFIPCSGTWPGAIGDFVASALSLDAAFWLEAGGPAELELTVLDWFKEWIGYPVDAEGQLTSGGSVANLQAIACARELRVGAMRGDLVLYVSDQSHSSVARAARVLGFLPEQVRILPTDRTFRLRPETLAAAIDADIERSFTPLLACVSAGATNTGAVDPLRDIAAVCAERGVWLHADAAYGGFAALTKRGRSALDGLELADSVTLDPHKWLYQSFECGSLLVREPRGLSRAFEVMPAYLADASGDEAEVNLSDRGIQLSRTSRALKVWLSVQTFGVDAFRAAIDRSLDAAEHAAERIRESAVLELLAEPTLGIVCFRRRLDGADEPAVAELNAGLARDAEEAGVAFVSSTTLRGKYALRLCPMNHTTTLADIDATLDFFESATVVQPPVQVERYPELARSWLRTMTFIEESPAPVEILSLPAPAFTVLLPSPAEMASLPPPESMVSLPDPVLIVSLPSPE